MNEKEEQTYIFSKLYDETSMTKLDEKISKCKLYKGQRNNENNSNKSWAEEIILLR